MKDHSLDVLSNVVSSRLLDESETVAESIESDEVVMKLILKKTVLEASCQKLSLAPQKILVNLKVRCKSLEIRVRIPTSQTMSVTHLKTTDQ